MRVIASKKEAVLQLQKNGFLNYFSFDITPFVRIVEYERNEYIIRSDRVLNRLVFLQEGTAKLYVLHKNGRQSLINFFTPPCVLGGTELFQLGKLPFPLVAQTKCICIEIDTSACRPSLLADAVFLRSLCDMILHQNVAQNQRYLNLANYPSINNFAACILLLQSNGIFKERYTEISEYLSISYRHLMFIINDLCNNGILKRSGKSLEILDYAELKTLADEIIDDNPYNSDWTEGHK